MRHFPVLVRGCDAIRLDRRACVATSTRGSVVPIGKNVPVRDLEDGNTGGHLVQAATNHGFLNIQHAPPARAVMFQKPRFRVP